TNDGQLCLWQLQPDASWKLQVTVPGHKAGEILMRLSYSPDGKLLAGGATDGIIRLWDVSDTGLTERHALKGHTGNIAALAFHPSQPILFSSANDLMLRQWDLANTEKTSVLFQDPNYRPNCISVSNDGKLLAFTQYALAPIRLLDLSNLSQPRQLPVV